MGEFAQSMVRRQTLSIIFFLLALILTSLFPKAEGEEKRTVTASGILRKAADDTYTLIENSKSRSRKTVHITEAEGYEEAYRALGELVGEEIKIEGREISRKSPWNITVALIAVQKAD